MRTETVLNQVQWAKDNNRYVNIELRYGRVFGGFVGRVRAKGDAVEIAWVAFGTDLIMSGEVVAISAKKL